MIKLLEQKQRDNFINLLNFLIDDEEGYDYTYQDLLSDIDNLFENDIVISIDNNNINGFAVVYKNNYLSDIIPNFRTISIDYYCTIDIKEEIFSYIKSNYSDIIMFCEYSDDIDMKYLTFQSFDIENDNISILGGYSILMDKPSDYFLSKYLINYYDKLKNYSKENLSFKMFSRKELQELLIDNNIGNYKIPCYRYNDTFFGFKYFSPEDLNRICLNNDVESKYFCIMFNDFILGIIKLSEYSFGQVSNSKYLSISYISVHYKYKNQGLATMMIKHLNDYLDNSLPLVGTRMSEEGKKCHIDNVFKKYITNTEFYRTDDEFYNFLMKKREVC